MAEAVSIARDVTIILMGLSVGVVCMVAALRLRGFLEEMQAMKKALVEMTHTIENQSERLGETLASVRALTDAVRVTHHDQIEPILRNLEYASRDLNDSLRTLNEVVQKGGKFSLETIQQATVYRDKVFRPVLEAASLLSGARAVLRALPVPKPKFLRRRK